MIRIQKTDSNLLQTSKFPAAVGLLTNQEKFSLDVFEGLGYFVFDKTENIFSAFFMDLVFELLSSQKIYLILVENSPGPVSKVRSHRKLLYEHRKGIGATNFTEIETSIDENHSLLSALVRVTKQNADYCLSHLLNSHFAFGYLAPLGCRSFITNRTDFLKNVSNEWLNNGKFTKINIPKLLVKHIRSGRQLFRISTNGRDEEIIEFFGHRSDAPLLAKSLEPVSLKYRSTFEN